MSNWRNFVTVTPLLPIPAENQFSGKSYLYYCCHNPCIFGLSLLGPFIRVSVRAFGSVLVVELEKRHFAWHKVNDSKDQNFLQVV